MQRILDTKIIGMDRPANWSGYGGVGSVESYLQSERPSPCARCSRLKEDKAGCAEVCADLALWQLGEET